MATPSAYRRYQSGVHNAEIEAAVKAMRAIPTRGGAVHDDVLRAFHQHADAAHPFHESGEDCLQRGYRARQRDRWRMVLSGFRPAAG